MLEHTELKVSSLYIAQMKQKCGIIECGRTAINRSLGRKTAPRPADKEKINQGGASAFRHDLRRSK